VYGGGGGGYARPQYLGGHLEMRVCDWVEGTAKDADVPTSPRSLVR
jgi:hypothetical protein